VFFGRIFFGRCNIGWLFGNCAGFTLLAFAQTGFGQKASRCNPVRGQLFYNYWALKIFVASKYYYN
jgi:hypothetical protein